MVKHAKTIIIIITTIIIYHYCLLITINYIYTHHHHHHHHPMEGSAPQQDIHAVLCPRSRVGLGYGRIL